jgi:hypothetical protein
MYTHIWLAMVDILYALHHVGICLCLRPWPCKLVCRWRMSELVLLQTIPLGLSPHCTCTLCGLLHNYVQVLHYYGDSYIILFSEYPPSHRYLTWSTRANLVAMSRLVCVDVLLLHEPIECFIIEVTIAELKHLFWSHLKFECKYRYRITGNFRGSTGCERFAEKHLKQ